MTRVIMTAVRNREPFVKYVQSHVPDLEVVWDKRQNAMDTFLRATELVGNDPVIRLEDDVCLVKGWRERVEAEISQRPNDLIQFFSRSKYDAEKGSRFKAGPTFAYNVCNYNPSGFSELVLEFYKTWDKRAIHPTGYDLLMGDVMHANNMNYYLVVPSLVNHAVTVSQIDKRRKRDRRSTTFINPEMKGYPYESGI